MTTTTRRPRTNAAPAAPTAHNWRDFALCREFDPDDFFPTGTHAQIREGERQAQQLCHQCPAMALCREWALKEGVAAGVWGGLTPKDRRRILRGQGQAVSSMAVEAWASEPDPDMVQAYLAGEESDVDDVDRLAAIGDGVRSGRTYQSFDEQHGLPLGTTATFVRRMRQAFAEAGYQFPFQQVEVSVQRAFTDGQVRQIRERFAAGGMTLGGMIRELGVDRKTVLNLLSGVTYQRAGGPVVDRSVLVAAKRLNTQDMGVAA